MKPITSIRYPSLYTTPELVGRKNIINQCQQVLDSTSSEPKLVFLYGLGGIGKTRLLEEVLENARQKNNFRVAEEVLDFYNILLHTPIDLTSAIFDTLTPPFDCFQSYQAAAQVLSRARLSGNAIELDKLREDTLDKFEQDLRLLAKNRRVVFALDTLERVVYGLSSWTNNVPIAEAWTWLMNRLPTWENVIVFAAGREGAFPAVEKIKENHPNLFQDIKVDSFTLEESLEYFEKVAQIVGEKGDPNLALRLKNMSQDFKRGAHTYSQGRPIMLSLLVDYLSFPDSSNLPEKLRRALPEVLSKEEIQSYEAELFDRLREGDLGETLIALGRVPKGCDEELLSRLITRKNSDGEDQPIPIEEARKRLRNIQRLSVVKVRRINDVQRFFLHDEMYDLLYRHVYSGYVDADDQKKAFEVIKNYYQIQRERSTQHLNGLYAPVEEQGRTDLDLQEVNKAHIAHQAILNEIMYYHLRQDLGRGYRTYCRYAHDAILSRDVLMDMQLQAELLSFLSSPPAPLLENDISVDTILSNLRIRPYARAWAQVKYDEGIKDSQIFIEEVQDEWESKFPSLLATVLMWAAGMYILRGKKDDFTKAESHLKKVYSLLSTENVYQKFSGFPYINTKLWYEKFIFAFVHHTHGYLKRVQGFMRDAEAEYQKAGLLLREIDVRCEMAATLNDMGFAQAELGKYHDGRANIYHAWELRKELGRRIPVALSLNTLAAVDVRDGRYREACQNSERALAIFRAFSQTNGLIMTLTTLAEATRRIAVTEPLMGVEERIAQLRRARDYAREAQGLSGTGQGEAARLVEALIEIGCACRDWVLWHKRSTHPGDDIDRIFKESRDTLTQAADLAQKNGLTYRYVDALVNRVWLEFYRFESVDECGETQPLNKLIDETDKSFPADSEIDKQPQVWAQKGKLYILKGHLARWEMAVCRKSEPKGLSPTVEALLKKIADNYLLGLEYSKKFSSDYRGIRQAKDSITNRLIDLNSEEMRVFCGHVNALYPNGSALEDLLRNRALWQIA